MDVVIIGAGLAGLSAACHVAGQGHNVRVLERESVPGGRAGLITQDGYRIDTGPSVLTMPDLIRNTFAAAGADMDDFLSLKLVDPMYRATFVDENKRPDGQILVRHGRQAMTEEIRNVCGASDAKAFGKFADWLGELYRIEMPNFIDRDFNSPLDLARPISAGIDLLRHGGFRRLSNVVGDYFADQRLQKLFSFQSMYAGLSPFDALAVYGVITYMDTVEGVYFPDGGMHAVSRGLADAATKAGATFDYGVTVSRIVRERGSAGRVIGVKTADGEVIKCDLVIANPDVPAVYRTLLPETPMPRVARRGEYSPSCALWLVGVDGKAPADAAHHNIHFGSDWKGAFDALLKQGSRMPDPSILVTVQNHTDPSLAPDGKSILYILEPTPNLDGNINWTEQREVFRETLRERVASYGYPISKEAVEVERFIDPMDWESMGMERGTPFALSHRFLQTGPFRPHTVDRRVPGMVLTGSSTLPGVGVPMVLLSGKLAAKRVEEYQLGGARRSRKSNVR
jgi:phytoene desaturase